jgi:hypothetical protein
MSTLTCVLLVIIMVPSLVALMALYVVIRLGLQGESYNPKSWYNRNNRIK